MKFTLSQRCGAIRQPIRSPKASRPRVVAKAVDQDQAMLEQEARLKAQIREGRVKNVMPKDIKQYMEDGWTILDVRPPNETKKAHVKDAVEVPLFRPDTSFDPSSLLKQMSAFGMGGWWLGGTHMVPNKGFIADVQSKVPKDAKVVITCQKGLRSLSAAEQLAKAGYQDLAWVVGGLDNTRAGDVPTRDGTDVRYAGIGGVSSLIGWTEIQQENAGPMGGFKGVLAIVGVIVALDLAVLGYEQIQYMQGKTPFQ